MIKWPTNVLVFQHAWNPKIYTLGETQWKQKLLNKLKFAANFNSSKIYPSDEMYSPKIEKVERSSGIRLWCPWLIASPTMSIVYIIHVNSIIRDRIILSV